MCRQCPDLERTRANHRILGQTPYYHGSMCSACGPFWAFRSSTLLLHQDIHSWLQKLVANTKTHRVTVASSCLQTLTQRNSSTCPCHSNTNNTVACLHLLVHQAPLHLFLLKHWSGKGSEEWPLQAPSWQLQTRKQFIAWSWFAIASQLQAKMQKDSETTDLDTIFLQWYNNEHEHEVNSIRVFHWSCAYV